MTTIGAMTGDHRGPPGNPPAETDTAPEPDARAATPTAPTAPAAASARTLSIPLPAAIVAALITAMFGLLFFSLDGLRNDIDTLRNEMNSDIGELRNEMNSDIGELRSDMDQRFGEISTVLLDHTDRLARIETHLDLIRSPDSASP